MAAITGNDGHALQPLKDAGMFHSSGLKWASRPVVFHRSTGKNVRLSENNTVATRVRGTGAVFTIGYGIVFTSEPVSIGQMLRVTLKERDTDWLNSMGIGFTGENPRSSRLRQEECLCWCDKHLLRLDEHDIFYNEKKLCELDFHTMDLAVGQSVGILLTRGRDLHWFVDDQWRGVVHVNNYPLGEPMWGVVDMYGVCKQVRAEICTVSTHPPFSEGRLIEMGLITPPQLLSPQPKSKHSDKDALIQQLLQEQDSFRQEIGTMDLQIDQLQRDLTRERETLSTENRQLWLQLTSTQQQLTNTQQQLTNTQQQLTHANELHRRSDTENQQLIATLRQQNDVLQRRVTSLSATNRSQNSQEVEFWQVSPEEVTIREDQILGGGAWGYVAKGTFRGTSVAVKRVYPAILQMSTVERIRREIRTMAQIRHPNLVLFIAAVLNEQTGPMIVTELLDTSLRSAYQANRIGANKRKIFRDVSSALVYLHGQREPIIHRDVSSANVLLVSQPNDSWLAKLSDFGSANLARYATTPGEGAIVYTAPEAYPHPPTSPTPRPPQTTKIDVYSFGVVACEVVTGVFPESDKFRDLLGSVGRVWPQIHHLITSCVSHSPQDRPTMDTVLSRIKQLDWEP